MSLDDLKRKNFDMPRTTQQRARDASGESVSAPLTARASRSPRLLTFIGRINDGFGARNEHEEKEQEG
ncbi:uncharacterized [Tachysurus ichikawai]